MVQEYSVKTMQDMQKKKIKKNSFHLPINEYNVDKDKECKKIECK